MTKNSDKKLLEKISKFSFLTKNQQNQLKKAILDMSEKKINSIKKNITKISLDPKKLKQDNQDYSKKIDEVEKELKFFLKTINERVGEYLKIKRESIEKKALKQIRESIK